MIDVRDERGGPAHDSVYGSMLPLAQWIVEKWWFVLNEPYRVGSVSDSRMLAHDRENRRWVQRHSLLAAREGNSLPDLTLFRDGGKVVARWLHDGAGAAHPWVRFIGNGERRMNPAAAEAGLSKFVEAVIARLDGLDDPEVQNLRADWAETCADRERNRKLCEWSAQLGRDPNDPDELTGELLETSGRELVKSRKRSGPICSKPRKLDTFPAISGGYNIPARRPRMPESPPAMESKCRRRTPTAPTRRGIEPPAPCGSDFGRLTATLHCVI